MRASVVLATLLVLASCGQPEPEAPAAPPETPFGTVAEVQAYLARIGPYVQEVGSLQASVEQGLSSGDPAGGPRRGTGRNLSEGAAAIHPRMQAIVKEFDALEPPALLAPFHRDTKKLMLLRLEAYRLLMEGWQTEEAGGDFQALYDSAETRLRDANEMIRLLNGQIVQITKSVEVASPPAETATAQ